MRIKEILSILFFLGIMASCTTDEMPKPDGGSGIVEEGESLMRLSIYNELRNGRTYGPVEFEAYPQEKEIRSIAFFTKTDDVGKFGDPDFELGAFNKYFSTEDLRSIHGLHEPLEQTGTGYRATIKVKSDGFGPKTQVYVIANYAENGLTDVLRNVGRWEDLKHVKANAETDNLKTPLLMLGYKGDVPLKSTQTENATIRLIRVVSRIDVINDALDPGGDPDKSFILESAQLIRPREYGYLLPNNEFQPEIPVLTSYPEVKAGNLPEGDPTKVMALYLYENENWDTDRKSAVRIKGTLFGKPYFKDIPLKKPDEAGKDGAPIAMERNFRYQLTIKLVETSGDVTWNIGMADWDDSTVIPINPTVMTPVITIVNLPDITQANWNPATKTYLFEGDKQETVKFTVTSLRTTTHSMTFELDKDGASIGLDDPGSAAYRKFLKKQAPVVTYSNISQTFEATTPEPLNSDFKVPVLIKLYIYDTTDKFYKDSIMFEFLPTYDDTKHFPVKVKGMYWAPVNVGAKEIEATASYTLDSYGYYFQWGRNEAKFLAAGKTTHAGPVSWERAVEAGGDLVDKYITGSDWLLSTDTKYSYRNRRWSQEVNDSPCPKGWRVPTEQECNTISRPFNWIGAENRMRLDGDEPNRFLYFPNTKWFSESNGGSSYSHGMGSWTSTFSTNNNPIRWVYYYSNGWNVGTANNFPPTASLPIRCVQAITP
ncbi:fibrobacter succinogenes major paralogous domain-containing protein [Parabacteroides sp. OttesenSCG-928-G07]|nr:fibrobacter succinogenes major paralogous domain-containing protein [Parabacteroides sp. OttesenSCG-928-G07]